MSLLSLGSRSAATFAGDALVLGIAPGAGDAPATLVGADLPKKALSHLGSLLAALEPSTAVGSTTTVAAVPGVAARRVVLVGLGGEEDDRPVTEVLRRAAGSATRAAGDGSVALALPHADGAGLAAIAEGALGGAYTFTAHKSAGGADAGTGSAKGKASSKGKGKDGDGDEREITVYSSLGRKDSPQDVLARAAVVGGAVSWARDLVNTAPNLLYPQTFTEQVQRVAAASSASRRLEVTVLDEEALADGGFGGILGVGQGSTRPPRIVRLAYRPARSGKTPPVALVGKGITFDTGGVCLKPPASMTTMKSDMAGAAAVAATVVAAAELGLPVPVTGYLCLAENMPGGNAQRPGDVVTMHNGTTVEIIDTDAEGRMVLADGMSLAVEQGAGRIIDVATLTGACVVALGPKIFGVMGNDDDLREQIAVASARVDEPSWPLPLPADLRSGLDSSVADIAHKGDRWGGALTAGLFLQEFARTEDGESVPWAHLDIAGPSFNEGGATGHLSKGGTGVAVTTLVELLATQEPTTKR